MKTTKEKEAIRKEAREILEEFGEYLKNATNNVAQKPSAGKLRKEREAQKCDEKFRKIMFENAPNKKDDCIVAEKGGW